MYYCSKIALTGVIAGTLLCPGISAQNSAGTWWVGTEQVECNHSWLTSENAAGLHALPSVRLSVIEGYANKQRGEFVDYGKSDNALTLGVSAESYYRLNPKVAFYGLLDYYSYKGKNAAGSYLIDPDNAPFNMVEYSDDNRGRKEMEHYHLTGAVSVELTNRIVVGGKLDYITANYAKTKDLRHKSELMDLDAGVGIIFKLNSRLEFGAGAVYRRRVEGVFLDMYGKTDQTYNSLIDYGVFWGKKEQFGENGYTSDGEEKPLTDTYYGGSLQINWKINSRWNLFNEFSARTRDGYYGEKSPYTVVFSDHSGVQFSYCGRLSFVREKDRHFLHFGAQYRTVENKENIYRHDNEGGGLNNVNYYGTLDTSDKKYLECEIGYTAFWNMQGENPLWVTKCRFAYFNRDITASLYPYYRTQQLHRYSAELNADRMLYYRDNAFTLHLGATYRNGGGTPYEDKIYASPGSDKSAPQSMPLYLMQEYEYFTNAAVKGEAGFKYARRISDKGVKAHVSFVYGFTKAFDVQHLYGDRLHEYTLKLGCTF